MNKIKQMILLLETPNIPLWLSVLALILAPAGIIMWILNAIKDRKKDKALVENQEANTVKTDAEAEKVRAEAHEIKVRADVLISDQTLKLAQRLTEECTMAKKELSEKDTMLDKTQADLQEVRVSLNQALKKVDELEFELVKEREFNKEISKKNESMWTQIVELTAELKRISNIQKT